MVRTAGIESCTRRWWLTVRSIGYAAPVSTSSHAKVAEARSSIADYRHLPFLRRLSRSFASSFSLSIRARKRAGKRERKNIRAYSPHMRTCVCTCVCMSCVRARVWTSVMSIFSLLILSFRSIFPVTNEYISRPSISHTWANERLCLSRRRGREMNDKLGLTASWPLSCQLSIKMTRECCASVQTIMLETRFLCNVCVNRRFGPLTVYVYVRSQDV